MSIANAAARPQRVIQGVCLVIAAAFTISIQDVIFKLFSLQLSLWQIFSLRALLAMPMLLVLARVWGIEIKDLVMALTKWPLLRSLFLTLTFMCFYAAIPFLSLSTVGAANYTAPIFVTLLSAYVIGEAVGRRGWIAVFVGFVGVIVLLQPGSDAFSPWVFLPLCGAVFYALTHIITRTKCASTPLPIMAMSLNTVMLTAGALMSCVVLVWQPDETLVRAYPNVLGSWSPMGVKDWLVLGVLSVFVIVITLLLTGAYQVAPPSTVATFE